MELGQLGQRVAVHRGTFGSGGWMWYVGGLLVASGVVAFGKALLHGDNSQLGTGALGLAIGGVLLVVPLMRWRQQVEVFEHGFLWTKLLGKVQGLRADIRGVKWISHISKRGQHDEVEVTMANGKRYSMTGIEHSEQLCNLLRATASAASPVASASAGPGVPGQAWTPGAWKPPGT